MRIVSIQYMRGLAAITVLIAHAVQYPLKVPDFDWIRLGRIGVILFFVISGFIMVFVTGKGSFSAPKFLERRILRIVPLYWLATAAVAILAILVPSALKTSSFSLGHFIASLLFIPHVGPGGDTSPLLKLGWTLNYEFFFYAVFAALFFLGAVKRMTVMMVLFTLIFICGYTYKPDNVILSTYSSYLILAFCCGGWLGILHQNGAFARAHAVFTPLLATLTILGVLGAFLLDRDTRGAELVGFSMILGSAGLVGLGLLNESRMPRWAMLETLGDASYSIYLGHIYFIGAANIALRPVLGPEPSLLIVAPIGAVAGAIGGLLIYFFVEKRLLALFHMRVGAKKTETPREASRGV